MEDKNFEIYNQDCMDFDYPKCRLILTDIPYDIINRSSNGLRNLNKGNADVLKFNIIDFLNKIYDCSDIFIIFCSNEQYSLIYDYFYKKNGTVRQIVFCKTNPSPMNGEYVYLSGTENAVWFKKRGTGKLNSKCKKNFFLHPCGKSKLHPTEKNHKLLEELILDNTNVGDLIIDPCMGSGSTGLVAINNNRKFIGIELDENYFNVTLNRLENI